MFISIRGAFAALALVASASGANAAPCDGRISGASEITPSQPLTLDAVLNEVRRVSPAVRAAGLEARALGAEADQAGRRLNPSLSIELENFAGGGALSGFDQTETTFALEQTFRLGGKRVLGERAARARQALASAQCSVILLQTELEAALLFTELTAAVKLRALAEESVDLADELAATVEGRVDAGAAAPPELARARTDAATSRSEVARTEAEVDRLRYALAALWGSAEPEFAPPAATASGGNDIPGENPGTHPVVDAAEAAVRARDAETALARRAAIPDVTVSAGYRRFEETGEEAFIAGVSIPLPLFDRGRDNVRASRFRGEAAQLSRTAIEQQLLAQQRAVISARRAAKTRLDILSGQALPAATEAYDAAVRGYQIGRFDLTTTLNARVALIETRLAVIDADLALQTQDLRLRALVSAAPFDGDIR